MKIGAEISVSSLSLGAMDQSITKRCQKAKEPVNLAMSVQFRQCIYDNLGASGLFRPHQWALLSPAYARKMKRNYATLNVSGALRAGIKRDSNADKGRVYITNSNVPYATAHQWGNADGNLPDRPYFPIRKDGSVLQGVKDLVLRAARLALTTKFK